jgi:hypothetical protein
VLLFPAGWAIVALFNTLHHALMYAYFGGFVVFSPILPITGTLQLVVGLAGEAVILLLNKYSWSREMDVCGGPQTVWANWTALALLGSYFILFLIEIFRRESKVNISVVKARAGRK